MAWCLHGAHSHAITPRKDGDHPTFGALVVQIGVHTASCLRAEWTVEEDEAIPVESIGYIKKGVSQQVVNPA